MLWWRILGPFQEEKAFAKKHFKTSAILVFQDNETVTMLVTQTSRLFQYNSITLLATRVERSYTVLRTYVWRSAMLLVMHLTLHC